MNFPIPPFDFTKIVLSPWTDNFSSYIWIALMGFLVASTCGLIGNYLILRRMALVGDAISHSILPGLALAFLIFTSRTSWVMFLGALISGLVTVLVIEVIHRKSRVKQDAAIGITFSTLFAIGVIIISLYADKVDLDQECVLYGEIAFVSLEPPLSLGGISLGPPSVLRMAVMALTTIILIVLFYKELLITSFDSSLAASLGISPTLVHYILMAVLSLVVVSAFEAVGAILVIAMLILPGATASLISNRLSLSLFYSILQSAVSSVLGIHLAVWLDCSMAAAMVMIASLLFILAWIFSPSQGLRPLIRGFSKSRIFEESDSTNQSCSESNPN